MPVLEPNNSNDKFNNNFNSEAEWFTIAYKYNIEALLVKIDPKNHNKIDQELLVNFKGAILAIRKQLKAISLERDEELRISKTAELQEHLTDLLYDLMAAYASSKTLICQLMSDSLSNSIS